MRDANQAGRGPKTFLARTGRRAKGVLAQLAAALANPEVADHEADARDLEARVFQPPRNIAGSGPSKS